MALAERLRTRGDIIERQVQLFFNPSRGLKEDYDRAYHHNLIEVGWPAGVVPLFDPRVKENTCAVVGAALGDEGKGRIVDNKVTSLLEIPEVQLVQVIRFQGGNNAGHTVEGNDGRKIDGHLVPSFYLYEAAVGIIDQGVIVHQDLETEVGYIEDRVGDVGGRLIVSENAILATDLERAEEGLNKLKSSGKTDGGTGRGIGPSYGHHTDRSGTVVADLIGRQWREIFSNRYDQYQRDFAAWGLSLSDTEVPDFEKSRVTHTNETRSLGTKAEYLDRLEHFRDWLSARDFVRNTYCMHRDAYNNPSIAKLFEGAQGAGLDVWLGTRPDVTSSNTSVYAVREGTGVYIAENIEEKIGVFKLTYTSDVGTMRHLPTQIELAREIRKASDLAPGATDDEKYGANVRDEGHEFGTTTGRPRSISFLDFEIMRYNARMSGIETLVATHIDIARKNRPIKVCTHYTDARGNVVPYQPGLKYLAEVNPNYLVLPGWDGEACRSAKSLDKLPENAQKFLSFVQARVGYPIVGVTSGPSRDNLLIFPGYNLRHS